MSTVEQQSRFDGLCFPSITVAYFGPTNTRGGTWRGSMRAYNGTVRVSESYSHSADSEDKQALAVARATWEKYADWDAIEEAERARVFIPGNAPSGRGYVFLAVPAYSF